MCDVPSQFFSLMLCVLLFPSIQTQQIRGICLVDQRLIHLSLCLVMSTYAAFFSVCSRAYSSFRLLTEGIFLRLKSSKAFFAALRKMMSPSYSARYFFGISGFAVSGVNLAGLRVVDDMRPQSLYLTHSHFSRCNRRFQLLNLSSAVTAAFESAAKSAKPCFSNIQKLWASV